MSKKIIFIVAIIFAAQCAIAQKSIRDYKYILVPTKFEFSKIEDQYQLNSLAKYLFNKHGFAAYLESDKLPDDLKNRRCLALTVEVLNDNSGLFKTKLEIILKDCDGNAVKGSKIGESRLKKYDRAYNEALRMAFETFEDLDKTDRIEIKDEETPLDVKLDNNEQEKINFEHGQINVDESEILYAQPLNDGYKLVNSEPKVVMILIITDAEHVYMVKDKNAIVFKENDTWIYYESNGDLKTRKELSIKF